MKRKRILAIATTIVVSISILFGNVNSAPLVIESQAAEMKCSMCGSTSFSYVAPIYKCCDTDKPGYYMHSCQYGALYYLNGNYYTASTFGNAYNSALKTSSGSHSFQPFNATYHKCLYGSTTEKHTFVKSSDEKHTCSVCGATYSHTIVVDKAVEATCTKSGRTAGSHCSDCNEIFEAQEVVPAKGHTEVTDAAVEATCTETGLTEGSHCSSCNKTIVAQEVIATKAHDYQNYKCSKCNSHEMKTGTCGTNATYSLDQYTGKLTISGTGSIDDSAFNNNESIKTVEIQEGITGIGGYAFAYCKNLESISIPSSVTSIGNVAFMYCTSLENVTIPSPEATIGGVAFQGCGKLRSITLSCPRTNIFYTAFYECYMLTYIFYNGTIDEWNQGNNLYDSLYGRDVVTSNYVEGASLALDGTLKVNIKFKSSASNDLAGWTINGDAVSVSDNYATIELAPKDFDQNIEIKYNGVQVKRFSVADMISYYKQSEDTKTIAKSLETYCSAADAYFAKEKVVDYSNSWESVKTATANHSVSMEDGYYGSSLVLESGTILRHYYTVEIANYTGKKNDMYYVDQIIPAHLYEKSSESDGTYCVNDYIYRALSNESSTADLKNLCVALYNYGVTAKEYSNR